MTKANWAIGDESRCSGCNVRACCYCCRRPGFVSQPDESPAGYGCESGAKSERREEEGRRVLFEMIGWFGVTMVVRCYDDQGTELKFWLPLFDGNPRTINKMLHLKFNTILAWRLAIGGHQVDG